jgi:hypothetical protein
MNSLDKSVTEQHKYEVGDILELVGHDRYFLIEKTDEYRYHYRELVTNSINKDTFYYIDNYTNLVKVA